MKNLKAHPAQHGIPDQLVSAKFQEFANTYSFEHVKLPELCTVKHKSQEHSEGSERPLQESCEVKAGPTSCPT